MSDEDNTERLQMLQEALGYHFVDDDKLALALTHRSHANEQTKPSSNRKLAHNERLEFLGDAILDCEISSLLYADFAEASEGLLTRYRSALVREEALCDVARAIDLGAVLRLGVGEMRSGGDSKPRMLASALEAVVGAVFVDGGYGAAAAVVRHLFADMIGALGADPSDHKSQLQERVQALGAAPPIYVLVDTQGPEHERIFVMDVHVDQKAVAQGKGRSKALASQQAASAAMCLEDGQLYVPQEA